MTKLKILVFFLIIPLSTFAQAQPKAKLFTEFINGFNFRNFTDLKENEPGAPIEGKFIAPFIVSPGKVQGTFKGQKKSRHSFFYYGGFKGVSDQYVGLVFGMQVFAESFLVMATYKPSGEMINALVLDNQAPGQVKRTWLISSKYHIEIKDYSITAPGATPLLSKYQVDNKGKILALSLPNNSQIPNNIQSKLLNQPHYRLLRSQSLKKVTPATNITLIYYDLGLNNLPVLITKHNRLINQFIFPEVKAFTKFEKAALKDVTGDGAKELLLYTNDTKGLYHHSKHLYIFKNPLQQSKTKLILSLTLAESQMTDMSYLYGTVTFDLEKLQFLKDTTGSTIIAKGLSYTLNGQEGAKANPKKVVKRFLWEKENQRFIKAK